jgi:hypothetical protein
MGTGYSSTIRMKISDVFRWLKNLFSGSKFGSWFEEAPPTLPVAHCGQPPGGASSTAVPKTVSTREKPEAPVPLGLIQGQGKTPRANEARTGHFTDPFVASPPRVLWQVDLGFGAVTEPTIIAGMIVVGVDQGHSSERARMLAIDAASGEIRWESGFPDGLQTSGILAGNLLVCGAAGNSVAALDPGTGRQVWRRDFQEETGCPVFHGGRLFCVSENELTALAPASGEIIWQTGLSGCYGLPALWNNHLLVMGKSTHLIAVDLENPRRIKTFNSQNSGEIIVFGDMALIVTTDTVLRLHLPTWSVKKNIESVPFRGGRHAMYFHSAVSRDRVIWGVDNLNVSDLTTLKTSFRLASDSHPSICGDLLYRCDFGCFSAVNLQTREEKVLLEFEGLRDPEKKHPLHAPVLTGGKAFLIGRRNHLYCLG